MTLMKILAAVLAVLWLGVAAPGCYHPDPTIGSYCASPAEGGEFCVDDDQSPFAAWNQAKLHGSLPIQMWATWPDAVTLDELVASEDKLNAWFADIDTVLSYVRDQQKCAECYKASMTGNLAGLLQQVKDRQAELLAQKAVDAIGKFRAAMVDKASVEKSPDLAAVAVDKRSMSAVQAVFDKAKKDAAPLSATYASIVTQFTAYRATEAAETAAYVAFAQQASAADLATLPDVVQAVLAASKKASGTPNDLALNAMKLSAQIQVFELAEQTEIAPYQDFMATHGAAMPDMGSSALRSLNAMLGYIQQRVARSDATATSLLSGIAMRKQALVLLNAGQPLRDKVAQAALVKATNAWSDEANARVAAISAGPPMSATMSLPYLAKRYDQLIVFLQMQPLCDPSSSSWREAGCTSLRGNFKAAETYLKTTLPALIKTGIGAMRTTGMDATLLDAAQAKLDTGDVKAAAIAYDAAVRSTEGT